MMPAFPPSRKSEYEDSGAGNPKSEFRLARESGHAQHFPSPKNHQSGPTSTRIQ